MEAADRGSFHVDEWVFSSVLLPSYEKGDPVRRRLYEAIKNVCHFGLSNVTGKGKKKKTLCKNGTVIRLFSMLEIAFCLQSYIALKLGQRECPPSTGTGQIRKKKKKLAVWLCWPS